MRDPITVRVLDTSHEETVDGVAAAKKRCLALSKEHPARWIDARRGPREPVHILEPLAFVEEPVQEPLLPEQEEALF